MLLIFVLSPDWHRLCWLYLWGNKQLLKEQSLIPTGGPWHPSPTPSVFCLSSHICLLQSGFSPFIYIFIFFNCYFLLQKGCIACKKFGLDSKPQSELTIVFLNLYYVQSSGLVLCSLMPFMPEYHFLRQKHNFFLWATVLPLTSQSLNHPRLWVITVPIPKFRSHWEI